MKKSTSFFLIIAFFVSQNNVLAYSKPSIVAEPKFTGGTTNIIYWKPGSGLDFQDVHRIPEDDTNQTSGLAKQNSSGIISTPFENLQHGVKYGYYVLGVAGQDTVRSNTVYSTQDAVAPDYVGSTVGREGPGLTIDLTWAPVTDDLSGVKGYVVYRNTGNGFSGIDTVFANAVAENGLYHYHDTPGGLTEGVETFYVVAAFDSVYNVGKGKEIGPFVPDATQPKSADFYWKKGFGYDFELPCPDDKLQPFGYNFRTWFKKSGFDTVFVYNPNLVYHLQGANAADSVLFIAVRDSSKYFDHHDQIGKSFFIKRFTIEVARDNAILYTGNGSIGASLLACTFDFTNDNKNADYFVNGHFYKYQVLFKDAAGNLSNSDRSFSRSFVFNGEKHLVGAYQDLYPPEKVSILKAQNEAVACNEREQLNFVFKPGKDLVSGLDSLIYLNWEIDGKIDSLAKVLYHSSALCNQLNLDDSVYTIIIDSVDYPSPRAFMVNYWLTSADRVGNYSKSDIYPIFYKLGPAIDYLDSIRVFNDTLRFTMKYQSDISIDSFRLNFVKNPEDCEAIYQVSFPNPLAGGNGKIDDTLSVPIDANFVAEEDSEFYVFVTANFSNGEVSLNSNKKEYGIDRDPPDPSLVSWRVLNPIENADSCIDSSFQDLPGVSLDSFETDLYEIFVKNVTENIIIASEKNLNKLPRFFPDSLVAIPLEIYDYQIILADTAGNRTTVEKIQTGFGTMPPTMDSVFYNIDREELTLNLTYSKGLFNTKRCIYQIIVDTLRYNPEVDDIHCNYFPPEPVAFKSGLWSSDGVEKVVDQNDISVTCKIKIENLKKREEIGSKYYIYALLYNEPNYKEFNGRLHSRAALASCDADGDVEIQKPFLILVDQPGFGKIWVDWDYPSDDMDKKKPNIFKIIRKYDNQDTTFIVRTPFMDDFNPDTSKTLSYTIIPGLKRTNASTKWYNSLADRKYIQDTEQGFVPFVSFPFDSLSTQYVRKSNATPVTAYYNTNTLTICWNWDTTRKVNNRPSVNNKPEFVGKISVKVADNPEFTHSIFKTITDVDSIEKIRLIQFPYINNPIRGGFINADTLYISLNAIDSLSNYENNIWPQTIVAILDKEKPEDFEIFSATDFADDSATNVVNLKIFWNRPKDELSGILKYNLRIEGLYPGKGPYAFTLDNLAEIDTLSPSYIFKPGVKDTLLCKNVIIDEDGNYPIDSKVVISVYDKLLNKRGKTVTVNDLATPYIHDFKLKLSREGKYYRLDWNSLKLKFDSYIVNYWNKPDSMWDGNFSGTTITDNHWKIDSTRIPVKPVYFRVVARLSEDTVSNWSGLVSTVITNSRGSQMFLTGINDNGNIPDQFQLYQNFPNPFNPSTTISFDVPKADIVLINIFDINGRKIKTLSNEKLPAGRHKIVWNGTDSFSNVVPTGVYFIVLQSTNYKSMKKCLLIK